jgi:phage terminase small subunit
MTAPKASKPRKPKKEKDKDKLTLREEAFAVHYAQHNNACASLRASRDCSRWKQTTVEVEACKMLAKPKVRLRVEALRDKVKALAEDRYLVTQERIIAELASIAFHDASDFFAWGPDGVAIKPSSELTARQRAVVASVSETKGRAPKIEVKLCDKQTALLALGRTLAMFKDRSEVTGKDGAAIKVESTPISDDDAARVIAFALAKAQQKSCA